MTDKLSLKYSHNIIDHLGLKLYQNKPTNVIAELVSNAYDADAEKVWIELDDKERIIIADNRAWHDSRRHQKEILSYWET